jgi:hypothetical protein
MTGLFRDAFGWLGRRAGGPLPRRRHAFYTLVVMAVLLSAVGVMVRPSAAVADDWYRDPCFNARQVNTTLSWAETEIEAGPEAIWRRYGHREKATEQTYNETWSTTKSASITVEGSLDLGKILELSGGYQSQMQVQMGASNGETVRTTPGEFVTVKPYVLYRFIKVITAWISADGSGQCGVSASVARVPTSWGRCMVRDNMTLAEECGAGVIRSGQGPGTGGTAPPTPPAPQPVTDVRNVADGTVLATTDTKRIYKMVGGAPVWQATCDDRICEPQSRPTTQAVINAGPATPRNGSSAVDQRGKVYLFVGGAPLWQDSCAAPVNCGTPVNVSDWSIDARDHMNRLPADGNLVQAVANGTDLPVAATLGGALVTFANPQEVIDTGHGTGWAGKVTAISGNSYNALGFDPADGTLIQGVAGGVSTPVAMIAGKAIIPFANPQEVVDVGYGGDWAGKVRAIPARIFNARSRIPTDNTLIQGTGGGASTPVATMVGGARINFASPQELVDAGYGTDWASKVRAIPSRAFNELRADVPADGTLIQGTNGSTPVAKIVGGAPVPFASPQEVIDVGYGAEWATHVRAVPHRAYTALPTVPANGTLVAKPGGNAVGVVLGGGWTQFWSMAELDESGHKDRPVHLIPGRVLDQMPRTIGDGVLVAKPGGNAIGVVVGGAYVQFWSEAELDEAGYRGQPVRVIPGRVLDALPRTIGDGVLVAKPGGNAIGVVVGGAYVQFWSMAELEESGHKDRPVLLIPGRVLDQMPRTIGDGVLVAKPSGNAIGVVVGGAYVQFWSMAELDEAGYRGQPVRVIPGRVLDALPRTVGDGALVKSPESATVWKIVGGKRTVTTETGPVRTVPKRVVDGIPLA